MSQASNPASTMIRPAPSNNSPGGAAPGAASAAGASAAWANVSSQMPGFIDRVKNIVLTPKTEWPVIAGEPTTVGQLYKGYAMPLMALMALVSFVHRSVIGYSFGFGTYRTPIVGGLVGALVGFVLGLVMLYIYALIIDGLAPTFAGQRDQRQALKVAVYAMTPAIIGTIGGLVPWLGPLIGLAALIYGIYVLYLGLPVVMRSPQDKAAGYTVAVIICGILVGLVFYFLLAMTMRFTGYGGLGGGFGGMSGAMTQEERQQRAAATVGEIIGGAMGTDQQGKANLSAAINNLAAAGQKMEQQQQAANANGAAQGSGSSDAQAPPTAANVQSAASATAGLLTALGGAMGGSVRHDPVDFHVLKDMLPASLPGMQRTNAEGSTKEAMGAKGSSATGEYQGQGNARVEIKIVDASAVSGLLSLAQSVSPDQTSESDTGYEKNATVGGRMVHEKYDNRSKHGELSAIVGQRFGVDVTGDGVDMATLEQIAGQVDLSKLESMKDAGARPN